MHVLRFFEVIAAGCLLATVPEPAFAYIDPGVGSLVFQGMIAGLVTIAAGWTALKAKIRALIDRKSAETKAEDTTISQ